MSMIWNCKRQVLKGADRVFYKYGDVIPDKAVSPMTRKSYEMKKWIVDEKEFINKTAKKKSKQKMNPTPKSDSTTDKPEK